MNEIVVAEPDRSFLIVTGVVVAAMVVAAVPVGSWIGGLIVLAAGGYGLKRFAQMKLSVTPSSVIVVNFTKRHMLPIEEVRIVDVESDDDEVGLTRLQPLWLSEAGGRFDTTGRLLYLTDDSGQRVHVGIVPVYGSRLDSIAEDLYRAIAAMKAAG